MNDLEWPMLSYYVIYYEKLRKVMQRTEKEALAVCVFQIEYFILLTYISYTFNMFKI